MSSHHPYRKAYSGLQRDKEMCYDSNNSPVYRGCPVWLHPMAAVVYVRWRPMGEADFTLS